MPTFLGMGPGNGAVAIDGLGDLLPDLPVEVHGADLVVQNIEPTLPLLDAAAGLRRR